MNGTSLDKYLRKRNKKFDPTAIIISGIGLVSVIFTIVSYEKSAASFLDTRSLIIVFGGTLASILFQFDLMSSLNCLKLTTQSLIKTPEKTLRNIMNQLDEAIINQLQLKDLRGGTDLNGEILNDIVYMQTQGLLLEEIQGFVTARITDEFLDRKVAVDILRRASIIAPALGLFGTVMGLIGVLKTLSDPAQIGPSMSLALMTTAYGAGLGSLVFTPLSGRLDHHNTIFLETYEQLLNKLAIILNREERQIQQSHQPDEHPI